MGDVLQAQAVAAAADEVGVWLGELDEPIISELLSDDSLLGAPVPADVDDSEYYSCDTGGAAAAPCNSGGRSHVAEQPAAVSSSTLCSVYSGPTIRDIEKALASRPYASSRSYSSLYFRRLGVASSRAPESKYTTKVRSCGGKMPADGYKWRKYGQKSIKNDPHPRSYYKCTSSRCGAKRQVEKSMDDPEMLIVTYEGSHLHGPFALLRHLHPPAVTDYSTGAADDVYVIRTTGAGGVGSRVRQSKETCGDAEQVRGVKLEQERVGLQKRSAGGRDAVPRAATDSCVDGSASSVPHDDAALPLALPCFSSDSLPTTNWSCLVDFPWSPEALLSADEI